MYFGNFGKLYYTDLSASKAIVSKTEIILFTIFCVKKKFTHIQLDFVSLLLDRINWNFS